MDDVKLLSVTGLRGGPRQSDKAARRGKPLTVWTGQQKQKKPLPALPRDDHEERDRAGDDDADRVRPWRYSRLPRAACLQWTPRPRPNSTPSWCG